MAAAEATQPEGDGAEEPGEDDGAAAECESPDASARIVPGQTGLRNLGNTCYMNAVLQALSHTHCFRAFFRDFMRAEAPLALGSVALCRQSTFAWRASAERSGERPPTLELCRALHAVLRVLWSGRWSSCAPHVLVQAVWTHVGNVFANRRQNDAQEFLLFLLARLDDELQPKPNPDDGPAPPVAAPPPAVAPPAPARRRAAAPPTTAPPPAAAPPTAVLPAAVPPTVMSSAAAPPPSLIGELFAVPLEQLVVCCHCSATSRRLEASHGLVLALPELPDEADAKAEAEAGGAGASAVAAGRAAAESDRVVSLRECVAHFLSETPISCYDCAACRARRDARAAVRVQSGAPLPPALLLSLCRSRYSAARGRYKDRTRVSFPPSFAFDEMFEGGEAGADAPATAAPAKAAVAGAAVAAVAAAAVAAGAVGARRTRTTRAAASAAERGETGPLAAAASEAARGSRAAVAGVARAARGRRVAGGAERVQYTLSAVVSHSGARRGCMCAPCVRRACGVYAVCMCMCRT